MRLDPRSLFAPLLAVAVLVLVMVLTTHALHRSGAWGGRPAPRAAVRTESSYARLDREIGRISRQGIADNLRDPFVYGGAPASAARPTKRRPPNPVPPPVPVLTAIVWDNDPRALIHWGDRDFTVRSGETFAEFRVVGITRDQVVLDHHGESVTLRRPIKGE